MEPSANVEAAAMTSWRSSKYAKMPQVVREHWHSLQCSTRNFPGANSSKPSVCWRIGMYHLLVRMENIREFPTNNAQQSSCFLSGCWDLRWIRKVFWICCAGSDSGIPKRTSDLHHFAQQNSLVPGSDNFILIFWELMSDHLFSSLKPFLKNDNVNNHESKSTSSQIFHFPMPRPVISHKTIYITHESYWVILRFLGALFSILLCREYIPHPQRQDVTLPKQHNPQVVSHLTHLAAIGCQQKHTLKLLKYDQQHW